MQYLKDKLEIHFWKVAKYLIRNGYGADCSEKDPYCSSCRAKEVVEWIDEHIDLIMS